MRIHDLPKKTLKAFVRLYSYAVSPLLGPSCRFYPTCSHYMADSLERHGAGKGLILGIKRLLKCHPWHKGEMLDPVPAEIAWTEIIGYKRGHRKDGCCHNKIES